MLYKCFLQFCSSACSAPPLFTSDPSSSNIAISSTKKFLTSHNSPIKTSRSRHLKTQWDERDVYTNAPRPMVLFRTCPLHQFTRGFSRCILGPASRGCSFLPGGLYINLQQNISFRIFSYWDWVLKCNWGKWRWDRKNQERRYKKNNPIEEEIFRIKYFLVYAHNIYNKNACFH